MNTSISPTTLFIARLLNRFSGRGMIILVYFDGILSTLAETTNLDNPFLRPSIHLSTDTSIDSSLWTKLPMTSFFSNELIVHLNENPSFDVLSLYHCIIHHSWPMFKCFDESVVQLFVCRVQLRFDWNMCRTSCNRIWKPKPPFEVKLAELSFKCTCAQ